jgi:hypothetical protein
MKLTPAHIDRLRKAATGNWDGRGLKAPLWAMQAAGYIAAVRPESGRGVITYRLTQPGRAALSAATGESDEASL